MFRCIFRNPGSDLRNRPVEPEQNHRLGLGYHQFRVVGRYRSCRNPDLRDPFIIPPGMENRCKPCRGSDDHLCGNVRRPVPDLAYGPCMDGLLCIALSQYPRSVMAEFQLPLLWDVFAISTYFTVSLLFWYCGLLPDLATVRDRAKLKWRKFFYGVLLSDGPVPPNTGSVMRPCPWYWPALAHRWYFRFIRSYPLTSPPPLFPAGIRPSSRLISLRVRYSRGFAMVQTLLMVTRKVLNLEEYITLEHIEVMNKVIVLTGSIVGIAYLTELFIAWYGQNPVRTVCLHPKPGKYLSAPMAGHIIS